MLAKDLDGERLTKYAMKIMAAKNIPYPLRDDMAQEAVIHVCKNLSKYDPSRGATVYTWAYRVMQQFVASAKRRWYRQQKREMQSQETDALIAAIFRHRKKLKILLKPTALRVAESLLEHGRIPYSDIVILAGVQSARSVSVHICHIRKVIEILDNQED